MIIEPRLQRAPTVIILPPTGKSDELKIRCPAFLAPRAAANTEVGWLKTSKEDDRCAVQSIECTQVPPGDPTLGGKSCILAFNSVALVGFSVIPSNGARAVMWTSSSDGKSETLADLGLLPNAQQAGNGTGPNTDTGFPSATPPAGGFAAHGFLWHGGVMTDLGAIAGNGYSSSAEGVNDSQEIVGWTTTLSSANGQVLRRASLWVGGTTYNLTFNLVGGPTVLLSDATAIDCQGNISAIGTPASGGGMHTYLLVRQGAARTNCPAQ